MGSSGVGQTIKIIGKVIGTLMVILSLIIGIVIMSESGYGIINFTTLGIAVILLGTFSGITVGSLMVGFGHLIESNDSIAAMMRNSQNQPISKNCSAKTAPSARSVPVLKPVAAKTQKPVEEAIDTDNIMKCPNCGAVNSKHQLKCVSCGEYLY